MDDEDIGSGLLSNIEDGVKVRPLLKTEDLRLIRDIFIEYGNSYAGSSKAIKSRELLKRVMRKVSN